VAPKLRCNVDAMPLGGRVKPGHDERLLKLLAVDS